MENIQKAEIEQCPENPKSNFSSDLSSLPPRARKSPTKPFLSMTQTIVLVTGANQGPGLEIVKKLAAEQPNHHILLASRDPSKGSEAAIAITGLTEGISVSFI
jgi:hypothetical protein